MSLQQRLTVAHSIYSEISIRTDFVANDSDNELAVMMSEVRTPKGTFLGIGLADTGKDNGLTALALKKMRDDSIEDALILAGVPLEVPGDPSPVKRGAAPKVVLPAETAAVTVSVARDPAGDPIKCADCNRPIEEYSASSTFVAADRVAEKTLKRFSVPLCALCSARRANPRMVIN